MDQPAWLSFLLSFRDHNSTCLLYKACMTADAPQIEKPQIFVEQVIFCVRPKGEEVFPVNKSIPTFGEMSSKARVEHKSIKDHRRSNTKLVL